MKIKDQNLRLALIEALCKKGVFKYPNLESLFKEEYEKEYDKTADYNYKPMKPILKRILSQEVEDHFDKTEDISWSTDCGLIETIWPYWDGEDDYFDIKSLDGIEDLKKLKTVKIQNLISDTEENRKIIELLQGRGILVQINGQTGWAPKKIILPLQQTSQQEISIPKLYPGIKKEISLKVALRDELQGTVDSAISKIFKITGLKVTEREEPTSLGGFRKIRETNAKNGDATYYSVITKIFWNESELDNASFYARHLLLSRHITLNASTDKTGIFHTLTVETFDIAPEELDLFLKEAFKI